MNRIATLALGASMALAASGCAMAGPGLVVGGLYSGYTLGSSANNDTAGAKQGEACAMSILGIIGLGDASIGAAKQAVNELLKDSAERDIDSVEAAVKNCFDSKDYIEGRTAFMEKRKPAFTGR